MVSEKSNDSVRAVDRALDILMAFTPTDFELTVAELLTRVDLSRPTLYRLLYTLQQNGFLIASGEPQKFRLGPSVAHLVHVWTSSLDLTEIAKPILRHLWEKTSETVALFVSQGDFRTCVAEIPSTHPLSFKVGVGYREQIMVGASGRAILAFESANEIQQRRYAETLHTSLEQYLAELESIRRRGYAISSEEVIPGAVAIAAPFFSANRQVAGSIGIFGPSVRLNGSQISQFGELLVNQAQAMSKELGGSRSTAA